MDEDGRCWCYREYEKENLIVQEAAAKIKDHTLPTENISITYAPPDMWARVKDTGRTMAELFTLNGVPIVKSDNNRVQGHMMIKDMLAPIPLKDPFVRKLFADPPDALPGLMFFEDLESVISDLGDIQADDNNPNDCAKQPHEVTHTVDGIRYFCVSRVLTAEPTPEVLAKDVEEDVGTDYDEYMCGGEITQSYM